MRVQLLRAQSKHTEFIYNLYCNDTVKRGHGIHRPIPGPHWRNIIQGLYEGWQHIFVITNGLVPIGHVGFQDCSKDDRRAEVTISVTPDMHRKSVGTTALSLVLDIGTSPVKSGGLGLESIWAGVMEDNTASQGLFTQAGFEHMGEIPKFFRFGADFYSRKLFHLSV